MGSSQESCLVTDGRLTAEPYGTQETEGEGRSVSSEQPAGNARAPLRVPLVIKRPCLLFWFSFQISFPLTIGFCCKSFTQRKAVYSSLLLVVVWDYLKNWISVVLLCFFFFFPL